MEMKKEQNREEILKDKSEAIHFTEENKDCFFKEEITVMKVTRRDKDAY